MITSTFS